MSNLSTTQPLISVVVPAYNQAHYLAEALQSVLEQRYTNFEIIVVDDGSTDDTAQVAASFSDPRVRYVFQENAGLSAARNCGLHMAKGEWISFLDSDDRFLPTKLERLAAEFVADGQLGLVAGQAIFIDGDGRTLDQRVETPLPADPADLLLGNPIHVGSVLVRREWLDAVEPFDESLRACEDWDLWLRLALAGCPMRSICEPVSLYRVHGDQMTRESTRMRTAMLATLAKMFVHHDLPDEWRARKRAAYAAAHLRATARALHAGEGEAARTDLASAVHLNPALLERGGTAVIETLMGWAHAPHAQPLRYATRIFDVLPAELAHVRHKRQQWLAELAAQLAFHAHERQEASRVRAFVWRTLRHQPARLSNRGLLSIGVRACLPRFKRFSSRQASQSSA